MRTDLEGRHTYWNEKFEQDFGWIYSQNGLSQADSLQSICEYHHERTLQAVNQCFAEPGKVVMVELDKPAYGGGIRTTLWEFIALLDEHEQPTGIQCMGIDVTERKKAEEQLRKLSKAVEQSPVSIVITNLEGKIEYANPAASKTTGYALDELLGKNPRVLKSGHTSQEEYEALWEAITHGKSWKGILRNRKKNGQLYWESSVISPILDESGKPSHFMAIKEDITERVRIQEELNFNDLR
ncbi:PAS domain S-box protein, partial [Arthrospira platensis SPKY1]|nr:PAS domain S-box protein [Arthrospira platensis SPKY1]